MLFYFFLRSCSAAGCLGWPRSSVRNGPSGCRSCSPARSVVTFITPTGSVWLMASLMYGAGLRLLERAELRVKDINFDRGELIVRDGKGGKDRVTMLPASLKEPLRNHLMRVKEQHEKDVAAGRGAVALPGALRAKYPNAPFEWGWQWVFPATRFYVDQATGRTAAASSSRVRASARCEECGPGCGHSSPGHVSFAAALVCDAPARGRV